MASPTLCCSSTSRAVLVAAPSACVRTSSSSASLSVSFSLDRRSLNGIRVSAGRRTLPLEQNLRRLSIRAEAGDVDVAEAAKPTRPTPAPKKKSRVSVKSGRKQRVVLRFLWLDKNIGISLDQVVPGHGIIPLSPYFFWPRKDAWEELKAKLDSKKWISSKTTIILLNQATDIINLWQQNATNSL